MPDRLPIAKRGCTVALTLLYVATDEQSAESGSLFDFYAIACPWRLEDMPDSCINELRDKRLVSQTVEHCYNSLIDQLCGG